MGDPQPQGKKKGPYETWNARETKMLIRLLTEGINQGWRDTSGCISKMTVEKKILPALNSALQCEKTYNNYQSKWKNLKNRYNSMLELIRFSSRFGWDPVTKKFTAPNHVWDDYEKAHPRQKSMRDETFEDYEDLQLIFDVGLATGKNAVGLGDDTDAETFGVKDNAPCELYSSLFGHLDGSQASGSRDSSMPQSKGGQRDKQNPKKRAKSGDGEDSGNSNPSMDSIRMEKTFTEMIEVSNQVVSLIQQREERQQREANSREAEKKKNNLWEAIKEISDLEENDRYDTLNEILKSGMKEVFISMSIEERMCWIRRNVY
ncbi:PREDICTED: uncharacterized protein At2g29880-like [Camelina sativa]|uniref:Uncharacterized protein At2g29880-like n=1 Tax=Camelina sativa TaxID=90675 RepID=A0ABM1QGT5_CAMSA|nr:PREDICTED: uncharacterized protein At2g29880-like [Camelina sativa]